MKGDAKTFSQKTIIPSDWVEKDVWTWGARACWPSALAEIFLWVSNKSPNTNREASPNQRWPLDLPFGGIGGGGWAFKPAPPLLQEPDDFTRWEAEPEEKLIVRAEAGCGRRRARTPTDSGSGEWRGPAGTPVRVHVFVSECERVSN